MEMTGKLFLSSETQTTEKVM